MGLTALVMVGCTAPAPEDEPDGLSSPRDSIDCGFLHGRQCKSKGPLANMVHARTLWDPCYGGEFSWTAVVDFEQGHDFLCVGGEATPSGCTRGGKLTGDTTYTGRADGRIAVEILTNGSIQSKGIVKLTATCDEPLFTAVWAPSATAHSQKLYRGLDWTQLNDKIVELASQNMQLTKIELWYPDLDSGYAYFDAIFDVGSGGGLDAGLTYAELQKLRISNAKQGLIISDVEAQQTRNGVVYVAVFKSGSATQQMYDGTASGFEAWAAPYLDDDYEVTTFESYQVADGGAHGTQYMMAVLSRSGGSKNTAGEWAVGLDLEYPSFAKAWKAHRAAGRTLSRLETRLVDGVRKYDGVFQKSANAKDFAPSTRWQQFSDQLEANRQSGWALVDLDRVKYGYVSYAPMAEELPVVNEYPAADPEWTARAEAFMHPPSQPVAGGYTLALSRDGELLGATSSGNTGDPNKLLTPDAHWDYLSISKTLTGMAALKLAEQKGWNIHTTKIMPFIQSRLDPAKIGQPGAGWDLWDISIWDALTHNSKLIAEGCNEPGSEKDIIVAANINVSAADGYSGANPCMLRLLIEETSGHTFEDYVRKNITVPVGIHDMDCVKDPEHVEVLDYPIAMGQPGAPGTAFSIVNDQCSAGGFKGTAMALLSIFEGMRNPGVLSEASLAEFRAASMTFYPGLENNVWRSAMRGGVGAGSTWIVQFPEDPFNNTSANMGTTAAWHHGVSVVLFGNFAGMGAPPLVDSMYSAPQ